MRKFREVAARHTNTVRDASAFVRMFRHFSEIEPDGAFNTEREYLYHRGLAVKQELAARFGEVDRLHVEGLLIEAGILPDPV